MKTIEIIFFVFALTVSLTGCVSYSTLQSGKPLEPGSVLVGGGSSVVLIDKSIGVIPEINARVNVVPQVDFGITYILPSVYYLDTKVQLLDKPFILSAGVGFSNLSYSEKSRNSNGNTAGWYPTLIAGQEHWYAAVKGVYFEKKVDVQFCGPKTKESGWLLTNIILGGVIGDHLRLLPELNIIFPKSGKTFLVPALGLQFLLSAF